MEANTAVAPTVQDIRNQQVENTQTLQETQESVHDLLEREAKNSLQSNSITILLTLGVTVTAVYFVFLKHILPRLDKMWGSFSNYLDKSIATCDSIAASSAKIGEGLQDHNDQAKGYSSAIMSEFKVVENKVDAIPSSIMCELKVVEDKIDRVKDAIIELKLSLKKD